ncbi:MAG: 4-(cytidine 5'-diphospho)-2-C-methyl-D-erythritol kinase [Phycisphaerales bacterium]|nr:MAG: 4-(cytidine 5'-diphospho)-2-C-methyl-D-erythritol kinase [Phycisphaerales bacterium]
MLAAVDFKKRLVHGQLFRLIGCGFAPFHSFIDHFRHDSHATWVEPADSANFSAGHAVSKNPNYAARSMTSHRLVQSAPAKLNLALSVGRPDDDGMHPICSWMVTISLSDELELKRLEAGSISRYAILWHEEARNQSEIDWSIRNDLAVRAHLAIENAVGRALPVQLKLAKRIPVAGGLGGGSSNAAAMLLACNSLFELGLTTKELQAIAAPLGSDVSFFLHGGSALVEGLGEYVTPLENRPTLHLVLIFPPVACPTGAIYRAFDEMISPDWSGPRPQMVRELIESPPESLREMELPNDLTEPAMSVKPELNEVRRKIARAADRSVHLAGSGSSLFVICDDALHAQALAETIERETELPAVAVQTWQPDPPEPATTDQPPDA